MGGTKPLVLMLPKVVSNVNSISSRIKVGGFVCGIPTSHFFVRVFDVFVEGIHAEKDLAAHIARHTVRIADQSGVLL